MFVVWALSHCRQISSNMKLGSRVPDWLRELGKLANGLAGVPFAPTGRTSLNVSCVRWSFVVFHILVLTNLTSLLGKNLAEDTADFGKSSLASRRHLGTSREDCFLISIRLLWPHAFCTQDLEHALSTAYLVTWCIGPVIFSMTHVRGHDIMEAVAVAAEAANCQSA